MSPSYQLEASKPRQAPPRHLNLKGVSTYASSANAGSEPLLYDLPSTTSMSPPTSPRKKNNLTSPTSPTSSGRPRPNNTRSNSRSTTPLGIAPSELEKFAEYCRAWYFEQDEASGRLMTQTLAATVSSQRAQYSRLQASIRSAYHRSVSAKKAAEFQAHLTASTPGGSLTLHARAEPRGELAQKERYDRFERFIRTWATEGMLGTKPFFESLWALMRLQVLPEKLGGAGSRRIEWEFEDAVFKESAGNDFMLEAIDVLKGVLAFEERAAPKRISPANSFDIPPPHLRSQSQPLQASANRTNPVQPHRGRAPSDPFLDTTTTPHQPSSFTSNFASTTSALPSPSSGLDERSYSTAVTTPSPGAELGKSQYFDMDDEEQQLRIWTTPDLTNPELSCLLELFPQFITRRTLPRFPSPVPPSVTDVEAATPVNDGRIRFGTGTMYIGPTVRSNGWEDGWWARFIMWLRRLFC